MKRKTYNMKHILELFGKKYGMDEVPYPVIIFYNDESGRIVKSILAEDVYASANCLLVFDSLDELIEHLPESDTVS